MLSTTAFLFLLWGILAFFIWRADRHKKHLAWLRSEWDRQHPILTDAQKAQQEVQREKDYQLALSRLNPEERAKWLSAVDAQKARMKETYRQVSPAHYLSEYEITQAVVRDHRQREADTASGETVRPATY